MNHHLKALCKFNWLWREFINDVPYIQAETYTINIHAPTFILLLDFWVYSLFSDNCSAMLLSAIVSQDTIVIVPDQIENAGIHIYFPFVSQFFNDKIHKTHEFDSLKYTVCTCAFGMCCPPTQICVLVWNVLSSNISLWAVGMYAHQHKFMCCPPTQVCVLVWNVLPTNTDSKKIWEILEATRWWLQQ